MGEDLILATMPMIPKREVEEVFGVIYGSSTRTRGLGGRFVSGIQAITGGKGTAYAKEIQKAREEALEALKNEARKLGANGVLSIDFETAEILEGFILESTCLNQLFSTVFQLYLQENFLRLCWLRWRRGLLPLWFGC